MRTGIWRYLLFRLAAWLVPHLGEATGYRLFSGLADALFLMARQTRAQVMGNLAHVLGPAAGRAQVRRVARLAFRNLLWNYYEMFHLPALTLADLQARVQLTGIEYGEAAVRPGTGAVFVFPHISNLEILMQIPLLYPQHRFLLLVERMPDERVFRLMRNLRAVHGLQLAPVSDMLQIVRLFKQGWNLVLGGDLDITHSGILVDFFGAPARMPDGAVRLALRAGAPLLIAHGWRNRGDAGVRGARGAVPRFCLNISPPLAPASTGDFRADVEQTVQDLVGRLEALIAAHPDQWLCFHHIWEDAPR